MKYDCAVIGSGISGLSAALLLARKNKKVALIEKNRFLSPVLRDFRRNGISCSPGFHYSGGFNKAGPLSVLFNYFGISEKIKVSPLPEKAFDTILLDGNRKILFPSGIENIRELLSSAFPSSRSAIEKYIEAIKEINNKTCFMNFEMDFGPYPEKLFRNESLEELLLKSGAEKTLIDVLGDYGYALYGSAAHEAPFYLHALVAGSLYYSAATVDGGGDAISKAFEKLLGKNGVDIFCGNPVTAVKVDGKRIFQGVELADGKFIESRDCISTIHPRLLKNIIPANAMRPVFFKKIELCENTFSPFMLFLDIDKVYKNNFNTNFYRIHRRNGNISDPDFFCASGCAVHEKSALAVLKPCPEETTLKFLSIAEEDYHSFKEEYSEKIISEFTDIFPEMKGRFKVLEALSPRSYQRYTGSINGSMYGLKKTVNNASLNPVTDIKGFYLAGQSVKIPGITGALVSALSACCNILDPIKLWKELKQYI